MVWLVQNCRSNKCLQFLKPPGLPGVLAPWAPCQGSALNPLGTLKRSLDPSPTHTPLNPKSAPGMGGRHKYKRTFGIMDLRTNELSD